MAGGGAAQPPNACVRRSAGWGSHMQMGPQAAYLAGSKALRAVRLPCRRIFHYSEGGNPFVSLEAFAVEMGNLERFQIDPIQAPNIHADHGLACGGQ